MNEKIVFMGTTEFSAYILENLIKNQYNIIAIISQPDRKIGRKQLIKPTITKEIGEKHNIPVYSFENINDNYDMLKNLDIDLILTCAYGQKINREILELPKFRSINIHASLLPKYRGAAPINAAIENGDTVSGNTIMYMEEKMDSGNIISYSKVNIDIKDTFTSFNEKLMINASELIIDTLPRFFNNDFKEIIQEETNVIYTKKFTSKDEEIIFNEDVLKVYNKMRSMIEKPGCFAYLKDVKIKFYDIFFEKNDGLNKYGKIVIDKKDYFKITCKNGYILVYEFQIEGRKRITFKEYLNGNKLLIQNNLIFKNGCE